MKSIKNLIGRGFFLALLTISVVSNTGCISVPMPRSVVQNNSSATLTILLVSGKKNDNGRLVASEIKPGATTVIDIPSARRGETVLVVKGERDGKFIGSINFVIGESIPVSPTYDPYYGYGGRTSYGTSRIIPLIITDPVLMGKNPPQ